MYSAGIIIFFLAIVHPFLCDDKEPIIDDVIKQHFHLDPKTEYKLHGEEFVHQLEKRDNRNRRSLILNDFDNEDLELLLRPTDGPLFTLTTRVYSAVPNATATGRVKYDQIPGVMEKVGTVLKDSEHLASVVINLDAYGRTTVNGVARSKRANTNLVIRSVPDHVLEQHLRKRRSTSDFPDKDFSKRPDHVSHIVARVHTSQAIRYPQGTRHPPGTPQINASSVIDSKVKRSTPPGYEGILYPKLLINLNTTYHTENELISSVEYLMAFWNAVEIPYRNLSNPSFRFHVGVIVISTTPEAIPYLPVLKNGAISIDDAINDHWFEVRDQIPLNLYHIAVSMTNCSMPIDGRVGVAQPGYGCEDPYKVKQKNAVAVLLDNGGFAGIPIAIHEIGHALGLEHDPEKGSACHVDDNNIMSPTASPSATSTLFSTCSKIKFASLLSQGKFSCMYSNPLTGERGMPHVMPGKLMSLDRQCQKLGYRRACAVDMDQICVKLHCTFTSFTMDRIRQQGEKDPLCFDFMHYYVAPGTPCGSQNDGIKRFCLFNQCLSFRG